MKINPLFVTAIHAAIKASEIIIKHYNSVYSQNTKEDGSPVTQADLDSSKCIRENLFNTGIPIIDEESTQEPYEIRREWEKVWCVDPLDGTKEFIKKNDEFAVNIALIENQKPIFGLIASPVEEKIIIGSKDFGVYLFSFNDFDSFQNWTKIEAPTKQKQITLIASRSHISSKTEVFIQKLESKFQQLNYVQKGSALKFFDLAQGLANVYPRFAPTMEWDIAAGQVILELLGGQVIDVYTNKPLVYNKENLMNPNFVASTSNFDFF